MNNLNEKLIKNSKNKIHSTIYLNENTIMKKRVERFMIQIERDLKLNNEYKHIEENSHILLAVFSHTSFLPTDIISYYDLIEIFGDKHRYTFPLEYHEYLSHLELRKDVAILLFGIRKPETKKKKGFCCF